VAGIPVRYQQLPFGTDPLQFVIDKNLTRRHLDESQRAMVASKLANMPAHRPEDKSANLQTSQASAASLLNVSTRSVASAAKVRDEGVPELVQAVEAGKLKVSVAADVATLTAEEQRALLTKVDKRVILEASKEIRTERAEKRRAERIERLADISKGNTTLGLQQTYPIVLADPPWRFEHPTYSLSRDIEENYPTLPIDEICALPVSELASESALLFLWVPTPLLEQAFQVIAAWGFEYRTGIVWDKCIVGMGNYVRQRHENLLIARRAEFPTPEPARRPPSIIEARRREHSRKPDEAYEIIERMYPDLPKIELFARNAREGWARWRNQAEAA
jgi:N6-adenosine-specific RNA methylase IME4